MKRRPVTRMNNTAWRSARKKAKLNELRVHDLKHTYGRRLRAAGVNYGDRQDLLGHRSGRITTHYSQAELSNLLNAANLVIRNSQALPRFISITNGCISTKKYKQLYQTIMARNETNKKR